MTAQCQRNKYLIYPCKSFTFFKNDFLWIPIFSLDRPVFNLQQEVEGAGGGGGVLKIRGFFFWERGFQIPFFFVFLVFFFFGAVFVLTERGGGGGGGGGGVLTDSRLFFYVKGIPNTFFTS